MPTSRTHCSVAIVLLCLLGVESFPKQVDCGEVEILRVDTLADVLPLGPDSNEIFDVSLNWTDTAVIAVTRLDVVRGRRHRHHRRRRIQEGLDENLWDDLLCSEEDDDIVRHVLDDDAGCDFQDDDAETTDHNRGGLSHFFEVRVLDVNSGEVSSKTPKSEDEEAVMLASRGQQGTCAHPTKVEITGVEGQGDLEVKVTYIRRSPNKWNVAALSFENAKTIEEGSLEWCGNVNLLKGNPGSCTASMSTPKWKIWLNPRDKFLVTADFIGHNEVAEVHALTVSLILYSDRGRTKVETILDERIVGHEVHHAEYQHSNTTSGWYYLELVRDRRHVYEYGLAFRIKRRCRDYRGRRFTMPRDLKNCAWLKSLDVESRNRHCNKSRSNAHVACQKTCGKCMDCPDDNPSANFYRRQKKCKSLPKDQASLEEICSSTDAGDICSESCGKCPTPSTRFVW